MSQTDERLYSLEQKLRARAEDRDRGDVHGFKAHLHRTGTCLLAEWELSGKTWKKMVGDGESDAAGPGGDGFEITKRGRYLAEAAFFYVTDAPEPGPWALTRLDWRDQKPGSFVAMARLATTDPETGKKQHTQWTAFGEGPHYLSADDAADDLAHYIEIGRARRQGAGLGAFTTLLIVAALGYGGWTWVKGHPGEVRDVLDRIEDIELPEMSRIPLPGEGESETPKDLGNPEPGSGGQEPEDTEPAETRTPSSAAEAERLRRLEDDLAEEERRNRELEDALALKEQEAEARRKDLARVRQGAGLSLPPCWPDESGTYVDFLFSIHIGDDGIRVTPDYPERRARDYGALPIDPAALDVPLSRAAFVEAFRPVYALTKTQDCRHYVHLLEGEHEALETYKIQRDAVEGYFYIHRPKWYK